MHNIEQVMDLHQIGQKRLAIAAMATSTEDWNTLASSLPHSFPFEWGTCWRQSTEYRVCDFAAEVGFYTDILGFSILALSNNYAMFTSPDGAFNVAFVPVKQGEETPSNAMAIEFMVNNIAATVQALQDRGIHFEVMPNLSASQPVLAMAAFRTPSGIQIRLWAVVNPVIETASSVLIEEQ